jgi:hypothetical protein
MTNENELKVGESVDFLESMYKFLMLPRHAQLDSAINLIKAQQSRIDLLESAIREHLNLSGIDELYKSTETLRNLMQNKS